MLGTAKTMWPLAALLCFACGETPEGGTVEERELQERERFGEMFDEVLPVLDDALEKQDLQESLPERTFTWRDDQRSNLRDINELLDDALAVLDTSLAQDVRRQIRGLNERIDADRESIRSAREERISAPSEEELGSLEGLNPMTTTREDLDELIEQKTEAIENAENTILELRSQLREELEAMGLEVTEADVDALLDTVTGDDQLSIAAVFHNIKNITEQLQQITAESGEAPQSARRYYGLYVVLLQVLDQAQGRLIRSIEDDYLPRLAVLLEQAEENIRDAERLIRNGEGEEVALRQNIESNQLTKDVIKLYRQHLEAHQAMVLRENEALEKLVNTAQNTYATVKLSASVSDLIQASQRDLEAVTSLKIPPLQGFQNERMREELKRLSATLSR